MHNVLQAVEWSNRKCFWPGPTGLWAVYTPEDKKCSLGKQITKYSWNTVNETWSLTQKYNRDFKQKRFCVTNFNRKLAFFSFHMPLRYQIYIAKCLYY